MPGLDGLRGLAALAVVVLHVWMYTDANRAGRPDLVDAVVGEMRVAVGLFFVLSGFLLARPWIAAARGERPMPDVRRFAVQRIARVGPAYWVALAGAFLLFRGTGHGREAGAAALPVFALFLENMSSATRGTLDPPMWSLGIEVAFYALLPLVGWGMVAAAARSRRALSVGLLAGGWALVA
jgi:acetyltransferase